jgi:ubiquinone/menaquinone biosynthesis C-methylase UbiE
MHPNPAEAALRARLEVERRRVNEEIGAYPRPITACDAQFNRLLEIRAWLTTQLRRAQAAEGSPEEFHRNLVRSARALDADLAARLEAASAADPLAGEIAPHYEEGREQARLTSPSGTLELIRTQQILQRYLPAPPAGVLDVGGGPGAYAFWLAGLGFEVHLLDLIPLHVEQARRTAATPGTPSLASAEVGDARHLPFPNESADAVLLLGPLYHLTERPDRLSALLEAHRVLRRGGLLFAAAISRFASALDGMRNGFLTDPAFAAIVEEDLRTGQHRNPSNHPGYFTTSFFHHPDELREEVVEAGFSVEGVLAVEGPAWLVASTAEAPSRPGERETLLSVLRALEAEPALLGASAHLLAVGRKHSAAEPEAG